MSVYDKAQTPSPNLNPLSIDIRFLGNLLGEIIREQHDNDALELVETVRALAKARRSGDPDAAERLYQLIGDLDLNACRILIKAFSNYFQLINIAEDQQRIRILREREANNALKESIYHALELLRASGVEAATLRALLEKISIRLVLTAHPSEAKRKEVLIKLHQIAEMVERKDAKPLLQREQKQLEAILREEIEELWQTRPTRATRATVEDEVDFGLYFITSMIMDVTVAIHHDLQDALQTYYPNEIWHDLPPLIGYASWIGGDRDGNPNVTPDVTLHTIQVLHETAKQVYLDAIGRLRDHLTQSAVEIPFSDELLESLDEEQPGFMENPRFRGEYYRLKMDSIWRKLATDAYPNKQALLDDLYLVQNSLLENRGQHVALGSVQELILKIRLFGLHLVPLDIREDTRKHRIAMAELFRYYGIHDNFAELNETQKQTLLNQEILSRRPFFPLTSNDALSETTHLVMQTWQMIGAAHQRYGPEVIDTFIASMSESPSDVLTMLLFAKEVGVQDHLDIVPLFETVEDLENAPQVMQILYENEVYKAHLTKRGNRQQIMLGYSDSGKDGGYINSNWSLYQAQQSLAEVCKPHDIQLELFHGRGGSIGRGGGPANRAILAQPPDSMQGRIKITEQGEVIAYRYSNAEIARRHLHQVVQAVLLATGQPHKTTLTQEWRSAMAFLSAAGREAYRQLVYETDRFLEYWQQATPINELAQMPIGSRPAKRKAGGFEQIRAIPWVFSWMQSRAIVPSWFGVGHAFEQYANQHPDGLTILQDMFKNWAFFKTLIDNVELDLAKADMGIAEQYATLVQDEALRDMIFQQIKTEHERACDWVCKITGQAYILEKTPVIHRSIDRRNPYVDPLNFIQVKLLRELRSLPPDHPQYRPLMRAVLACVNGIAAGLKNTG